MTEAPDLRLTPTQRLHEVTMAALTRPAARASESVEVTRNAKGDWQFTVSGITGEGETLSDCALRVLAIAANVHDTYPLSRKQEHDRKTLPNEMD